MKYGVLSVDIGFHVLRTGTNTSTSLNDMTPSTIFATPNLNKTDPLAHEGFHNTLVPKPNQIDSHIPFCINNSANMTNRLLVVASLVMIRHHEILLRPLGA